MKYLLISSIILATLATTAIANDNKPCAINSMNGRWVSFQGAVLGNPHTGDCHFSVANGMAQGACDFSNGFKSPFQGELVVNTDCSATFDMDFAPAPVISKFKIQLHKDKKSFVGRWGNNLGVIGITNAVKQ